MTAGPALRVGVADAAHSAAVAAVRRAAYRQAAEFSWRDEATLAWSAADDAGAVLGIWDAQGRLLSTLRASVFHNHAAAEAFLQYRLAGVDVALPTLVFSRAATHPDAARHGLFALMRLAYLSALPATPLHSLLAVVYEGGPRLRAMQDAGYHLTPARAGWDSEAVARTQPLLAVLPRAQFSRALDTVATALVENCAQVQIDSTAIAAAFSALCCSTS